MLTLNISYLLIYFCQLYLSKAKKQKAIFS